MAVKAIPDGYHTVTPTMVVNGAAKLIDFIKQAFGGEEAFRMPGPGGQIMHAEMRIGDSVVMMNDPMQQPPVPASLFLYVTDVDGVYKRAVMAGATSVSEPADMFWGDRMAQVKDQFGNQWAIATHKEDVAPQEMQKRMEAAMKQRS
jgi:PhnB protein